MPYVIQPIRAQIDMYNPPISDATNCKHSILPAQLSDQPAEQGYILDICDWSAYVSCVIQPIRAQMNIYNPPITDATNSKHGILPVQLSDKPAETRIVIRPL